MKKSYKKHTFEERLLCVERYLSGESAQSIGRELCIRKQDIPIYVAMYEQFGAEGLRKQPNVRPTYALKVQVASHCKKSWLRSISAYKTTR